MLLLIAIGFNADLFVANHRPAMSSVAWCRDPGKESVLLAAPSWAHGDAHAVYLDTPVLAREPHGQMTRPERRRLPGGSPGWTWVGDGRRRGCDAAMCWSLR